MKFEFELTPKFFKKRNKGAIMTESNPVTIEETNEDRDYINDLKEGAAQLVREHPVAVLGVGATIFLLGYSMGKSHALGTMVKAAVQA